MPEKGNGNLFAEDQRHSRCLCSGRPLCSGYGAGPDAVAATRDYVARGSITSAADVSHALAVVESADGVVSGLPANTVVMQPAGLGEANLDNHVDFADLLTLAQQYGRGSANWDHGGFDGGGTVGFPDLLILAQSYAQGVAADPATISKRRPRRR